MPCLLTKWTNWPILCASQLYWLVHLKIASSFSLNTLPLHTGQNFGDEIILFLFLAFSITLMTCGITSPALWICTISPIRISFFVISSKLWRVALDTSTPPIFTSSKRATGVIAPVLPTWKSISIILVEVFSAENFKAIAHRGFLPTKPNLSCKS